MRLLPRRFEDMVDGLRLHEVVPLCHVLQCADAVTRTCT